MEAIILAGGLGTRLARVVSDVPKPMASVAGRPFLSYIFDDIKSQGITHVVLAVCHKKECIMDFFGEHYEGIEIDYSVEAFPLGTGGAIKQALTLCREERVFVFNGDSFLAVNLRELRNYSNRHNFLISIVLKPLTNFSRYGTVDVGENGVVRSFKEKQPCAAGLINGGIYDIKRDALKEYPVRFGMERDCFPALLAQQKIGSIVSNGYFIDIGIPKDYEKIQSESYLLKS